MKVPDVRFRTSSTDKAVFLRYNLSVKRPFREKTDSSARFVKAINHTIAVFGRIYGITDCLAVFSRQLPVNCNIVILLYNWHYQHTNSEITSCPPLMKISTVPTSSRTVSCGSYANASLKIVLPSYETRSLPSL